MNYFVDPVKGNDAFTGTTAHQPWRSLAKVNELRLNPGDHVIIAPGVFHGSLAPHAAGLPDDPVVIEFLPGVHRFEPDGATQVTYFVSNACGSPDEPRPVAMLIKDCRNLQIIGRGDSAILLGGRMIYAVNDHAQNITYAGLKFDLARPTVSEFRVASADADHAIIQIAEGSTYTIDDGRLQWTGDIGSGMLMLQWVDLSIGSCKRLGSKGDPLVNAIARDLGDNRVELTYPPGTCPLRPNTQYQFRNCHRDNTSVITTRCKDMQWRDCDFYMLPGMGLICQFTEHLTFERVNCIPRPGTIRTCPSWADSFHLSGCRGRLLVDGCRFSGTQDDPINIHGTYLRIIEQTGPRQLLVRFMHQQTYGFAAFEPGDQIELVRHATLQPYAMNTVDAIQRRTDHDWLLTLREPIAKFGQNDVIDNVTWHPDVTIRNCTVDTDSTRGFLVTTNRRAVVENCTFTRTQMSAILLAQDADKWFESGSVRDLTIRNNRFIHCGRPVIWIHPNVTDTACDQPVHRNIRIEGNTFEGGNIRAHHVNGLTIIGNRFSSPAPPLEQQHCIEVVVKDNITVSP